MSDQSLTGLLAFTGTLLVAIIGGYVALAGKRMEIASKREDDERKEHREALAKMERERDEARRLADDLRDKFDEKQRELDRALAEIAIYYHATGQSHALKLQADQIAKERGR